MNRWPFLLFAFSSLLLACSEPSLDNTVFRCVTDADCRANEVCTTMQGQLACVERTTSTLRIGMSGPLQGASRDLGTEMRRGINAMFQRTNEEQGGIHGREIVLDSMNDNYDPTLALEVTRQLLDIRRDSTNPNQPDVRGPNSVFALLGSIGTPTMLATAPLATKNQVLFFGPFTGAQEYLRDGTNSPYVYNYRAGYYDEAAAIVEYLATARLPRVLSVPDDYRRLLVFAQNDSYGDSGYQGLIEAYNRRIGPLPSSTAIARVGYEREQVDTVDPAIVQTQVFLGNLIRDTDQPQSAAVVMVDTYQPGNKLVRAIKDWIGADARRAELLDVAFIHVSFVGSDSLALALTNAPATYAHAGRSDGIASYAEGVMVTQVVPSYDSQAWGVQQYRNDIDQLDSGPYTFTSLEGYIAAHLFVTALQMHDSALTTETFRTTLDERIVDLDIGIGTLLSFGPTDHQASDAVWLSELQADGSFAVPYVWTPDDGIQPN